MCQCMAQVTRSFSLHSEAGATRQAYLEITPLKKLSSIPRVFGLATIETKLSTKYGNMTEIGTSTAERAIEDGQRDDG